MSIVIRKRFCTDVLKRPGIFSFLNFSSVGYRLSEKQENHSVEYFCDGMLLAFLISILTFTKIKRVSFDFTSICNEVLDYAEKNNIGIIFVGATESECKKFKRKISEIHPSLDIEVVNGYFSDSELKYIKDLLVSERFGIVVAGLGAPKQENFIVMLSSYFPNKIYFTCGGFIRQEAMQDKQYYPYLIDKCKMRAFYRMYKEPHTIKRYLLDYPKNLTKILISTMTSKVFLVKD